MKCHPPTLLWPLLSLLVYVVCARADEPRLVLNTGGHTSLIRKVVFTSDNKYLISAGDDKVIRVWEVETGRLARTLRGEIGNGDEGKIFAMALSPNDKYLAVGGFLAGDLPNHNPIRLHDFQTGAVIGLLKGHKKEIKALAFSQDGRYLVSGSADDTVRVWDVAPNSMKQRHLLAEHSNDVNAVAFSPDGRWIVSGDSGGALKLWDAERGKLDKELDDKHSDEVLSVAFTPDGSYLVSGGRDKKVLLWKTQTGNFDRELFKQETDVTSLSFNPAGNRLLTGSGIGSKGIGQVCYVLGFPNGNEIRKFGQHDNIVLATAFAPSGALVATAGGSGNPIYLWDPENGYLKRTLTGKGQSVWSVGFASNGQSIAFGAKPVHTNDNERGPLQHTVTLKTDEADDVRLGGEVKSETDFVRALETSGEYSLKPSKDPDPILQIYRNGEVKGGIPRHDEASGFAHLCYGFTQNGPQFVAGGRGGVLKLYDTQTGKEQRKFVGHTGNVWAVAVSPDNRTLVSGSDDQTMCLWDLESKAPEVNPLLTIFVAQDNEWIAWTPQGYYTSSLNGDRYIGWHVNHGVGQKADYYSAVQFKTQFYRPDVVREYLRMRGKPEPASKTANENRGTAATGNNTLDKILSIIPPVVFISSPESDESTVEEGFLTIKAEAQAASHTLPVSGLKILLNGLQVGATKGSQLEVRATLQLGPNTIEVIATNEEAASEPKRRKVIYKGQPTNTAKSNLILLALGIKEYLRPEFNNLKFAAQDALQVSERFKGQTSIFKQVKIEVLTDKEVTREAVLRKLDWLKREAKQDDVVVLYLSGHAGTSGNNYYFYTYQHDPGVHPELYDVKWSTLIDALIATPSTKRILFVDTCRAGAAMGGARTKGDEGLLEALKDLQYNYQDVVFLAASAHNEPSLESDEFKHGVFTYALLQGLQGEADVMKSDQVIYINELGNFVRERVGELSKGAQHAVYYEPRSDSGFKPFPLFALPKY